MSPVNPFALDGRGVWVFGGAGHLGRGVVALLAAMGARVLCVDLENRAEEFVQSAGLKGRVTPAALDVNCEDGVAAFVGQQIAGHGVPHGLVVMTYASTAKKMEDLTPEEFDRANHGNLTATFMLARHVGEGMARRGSGSIVLFSSMYGTVAPDPGVYGPPMNPNPIEYGVGKAGIQQMARYLAVHYGPRGLRCNSISPGPFPDAAVQRDHAGFLERLSEKVPLRRIGRASEIAGPVAFLLSDASSFVNGHNLAVDGGWTTW